MRPTTTPSMWMRSAHNAKTLAGEFYAARDVYDAETEKIFLSDWLYAGRASDLAEPGSYFLVTVEQESVIVLRDTDGTVRAHHNVCRHRGTRLCTEERGRFSRSIQCPYHAWTYALDGSLIGAPHMNDVDGFDTSAFSLHPVAVAVWEGGVFVNLASDAAPLSAAFEPLMGKFAAWEMDKLHTVHRINYDVAANWKLVFQNYSECYHCPGLHPQLNRLTPFRDSSNDLDEGPFLGGPMQLAAGHDSMTMTGRSCAPALGRVTRDDRRRVFYYTIFPTMLLSLFPDYVLVHRIERRATDRTRIVCDWLFHPEATARPDFDPSDAIEFWNVTNTQDWHVSELSQRGVSSRAYQPGPYSELESMVAAWDRHYLGTIER